MEVDNPHLVEENRIPIPPCYPLLYLCVAGYVKLFSCGFASPQVRQSRSDFCSVEAMRCSSPTFRARTKLNGLGLSGEAGANNFFPDQCGHTGGSDIRVKAGGLLPGELSITNLSTWMA